MNDRLTAGPLIQGWENLPMTSPSDVVYEPSTPAYVAPPVELSSLDAAEALSTHQEINERRARVENSELLQHLRGL